MRKNIDKWNHYKGILEEEADKFLDNFRDEIPDKFYKVNPSGSLSEYIVKELDYSFRDHDIRTFSRKTRPSREEVKSIKQAAENPPELDRDNVLIRYRQFFGNGGKVLGSLRLNALKEGPYYTDKQEALRECAKLQAKKGIEDRMVESGDYFRCTYCNKITPSKDALERTMISRMYDNFKKKFKFCSEQCATHNQMSLEG